MTKFGMMMQVARIIFSKGPPRPHPWGGAPASLKFLGPYLRPNGLTWRDDMWRGDRDSDTRAAGAVFTQVTWLKSVHSRTQYQSINQSISIRLLMA